jgi:hypothetical protein
VKLLVLVDSWCGTLSLVFINVASTIYFDLVRKWKSSTVTVYKHDKKLFLQDYPYKPNFLTFAYLRPQPPVSIIPKKCGKLL